MSLADGAEFAGYRILRLLGTGGMGEVYLAQHPRLPRRDALKILPVEASSNDEFRDRFNREADLVATLYHPHIIGVHDRGETNGRLWISMDYIDGPDAGRLVRDQYPNGLPRPKVIRVVAAVADALDYAHNRGLLHRDVKPANILLTADGQRILLADFGIARSMTETSGLTATNMVLGTVTYAAPEQLRGQHIDGRADQYALAATAYELLTGATLFGNPNPAVVIGRHLSDAPPALAGVRPELADLDPVFRVALAKNPADRFGSCTEFARALADPPAARAEVPVGATVPTPVQRTRQMPVPQFSDETQFADEPRFSDERYPVDDPVGVPAVSSTRRRQSAIATVVAILVLTGLAYVLVARPWRNDAENVSTPGSSTSPTSSAVMTTATTTTTTATTSTTTTNLTFDGMRDFVTGLYGLLPARPTEAWAKFDPNYQNRAGQQDFLGFWSTIASVTVLSVTPRDTTSVVARLRYVRDDGHVDTEDRWLKITLADGKMLVYDSERIGAA